MGTARATSTRTYDAGRSMADILKVATAEFADKGLSGARIDEIAAATRTSKRMIYYHFGSKRGLYDAVRERLGGDTFERATHQGASMSDAAVLDFLVNELARLRRELVQLQPPGLRREPWS